MTLSLDKAISVARNTVARAGGEANPAGRMWGRFPEVGLLVTVGLMLVSLAYAGGRSGAGWSEPVFWAGQLVLFLPPLLRVLCARTVTEPEGFGIAMVLGLAYFGAAYCFSPLEFKFIDELQHWRTAADILGTGSLFGYNYSLPISPVYPGLENVATAVVQLTGLSIFAAGVIVMCLARVLLTVGLYLLFRHVSGSVRVATLASILFTTAPYYKSILAKFIYGGIALPFLVLAVYAAARVLTLPRHRERYTWWALAVVCIAMTVISHHLTSWILAAVLLLALFAFVLNRNGPGVRHLAGLAVVCLAAIVSWITFVAPSTPDYLRPAVSDLVSGVSKTLSGQVGKSDGGFVHGPLADAVASYSSVLVIAGCVPVAAYWIWRKHRANVWALTMAAGALGYLAIPVVRVISTSGSEDAVRALTYLYIPLALVLATAGTALVRGWRPRVRAVGCAAAIATLAMGGGVTSGWPPYWGRIPADHMVVDGYENAVEPEGVGAAYWTQEMLEPGSRIAADDTNYTLMGPYGQQTMVRDTAELYTAPEFRDEDRAEVIADHVQYLVADRRLTQQLPAGGSYFPDDPRAYRYMTTLPLAVLTKFDNVSGVQRIFDSGNIVIYDLRDLDHAP